MLIIGAIGFGVYWLFIRPAPTCFDNKQNQKETGIDCGGSCISCDLKNVKPLVISTPVLFDLEGAISVVFKVANPNDNYGAESFVYKVNFYNKNNQLYDSITNKSFIYSGDSKELAEINTAVVKNEISRAEILTSDIKWLSEKEWKKPLFNVMNAQTKREKNYFTVSGAIKNPNSFGIAQIEITAVLEDALGIDAGVSKTAIENLKPFEERNFRFFVQADKSLLKNIKLENTRLSIDVRREAK